MLLSLQQKTDREVGKCYYPCKWKTDRKVAKCYYPYSRKQAGRWVNATIPTAENRQGWVHVTIPTAEKKQGGGYMLLYLPQITDREVVKCYYPYSRKQTERWVSVTIPTADNRQGGG